MKKLLILTFFAILSFILLSTYGIFESDTTKEVDMKLAAWEITVNDSIVSSENKTFNIENIVWNKKETVKEGKIAPGMDGYFDIVINPKNTDVSIRYDITLDIEYLNNINKAFKVTKIEELNGNKLTLTNKNTYTGIINIDNSIKNTIRIYMKWEDLEDNNEIDYNIGTTNEEIEFPININITQYLNEEIIEYSEE